MKKTLLALSLTLAACTTMASEYEYEYVTEIPEINALSGGPANTLNCTISGNLLATTNTIKINMTTKSAVASSYILGDSEVETDCSRKADNLICNGGFFDINIKDILVSESGLNIPAKYTNYGLLGMTTKNIYCNLK